MTDQVRRHRAKNEIMIQGFPFQSSLFPGDTLTLHVSTDAPQFRVDIYRQGASLAFMFSSDWFASPGINFPDHEADADWSQDQTEENGLTQGWPPFDISVPSSFVSGVYIAMLVEGDGNNQPRGNTPPLDTTTPDARFGKALFVVRSPAPGVRTKILYKLPLFTYHAYCDVGGWALYTPPASETQGEGESPAFVSIRRPGGGTGGHPWDDWNFDPADRSSARQVFAHWDAPFIAWLEQNGYAIDYATDLDLHTDPNMLAPYSLVLSVGHDEYWSTEMRDQAELGFIQRGGNFAFFSGNTCWWKVDLTDGYRLRRTDNWSKTPNRPENSLTGVSWRNGFEGDKDRPKFGYIVQNHAHWIFAGTGVNGAGLQEGDRFGFDEELIGYEADGANFDRTQGPPFVPKLDDGTPATFVILGVGDALQFAGGGNGNAAATMGVYTNGGTVFTGATTDWSRVVGLNGESNTVQITRNVINRLRRSGPAHYTAVWQPSTEGEIQVYGWTYEDYRAKYDELWPQGWRLKLLDVYVVNGQVLYTAVWQPSSTEGEIQVYGWTYEDYRAKYDELWPQGWRLKLLDVYVVNGQVLYTAVWQPSTEGEIQVYGWTYEDYRAKYDALWPQGWRLKLLDVYVVSGQVLYTAAWQPSTEGEIQVYGWTYDDYRAKYDELWRQGWRLKLLDVYAV